MFKTKESAITSANEVGGSRTVVTETVETRTMPDGKVVTTIKKTTTMAGDDIDPSFKNLELMESSVQSGQTIVTKVVRSSDKEETVTKEQKKSSGKSFAERLCFKPRSKESKSKESKPKESKSKNEKDASQTVKTTSSADVQKFEKDSLKAHNDYRAKHGVPSLKLSKQLCAYSKEWADHLIATNTFQHRTEHKYGENIYTKWSSDPNHVVLGNDAVDSWYSEIKDHTFGKEPTSLKSGHFTQLIWKESKELGIALSRGNNGRVIVVANYDPVGNFVGKFTENVPPPKK